MDLISEQVYIPSYRKRTPVGRRLALLAGCVGVLYLAERRAGVLTVAWRSVTR
jgi:hypothetical protein